MSAGTSGCAPPRPGATGVYRRRRPERTVLYELVQHHLESWLARTREADPDADPVPAYVEREFRAYLECGILCCGFARAFCAACGKDFLIAFSCRGRGMCPSCTTRRMAETAAHLVDHVFAFVPVRQWVIAFPKRLRWFVHRDPAVLNAVLRIVLRAIESRLHQACPDAPPGARFGAVSFLQRFGSSLNVHLHFHCCIADGVFSAHSDQLRFHPATDLTHTDIAALQQVIRTRVLRCFVRRGLLTAETAADMLRWDHGGGFSLHAAVRVEATDRAALERLLRYCARPAFAGERLAWDEQTKQQLRYTLPRPAHDGQCVLVLTPLEVLDRLAALDCRDAGGRATQEQLPRFRRRADIATAITARSRPTPHYARSSAPLPASRCPTPVRALLTTRARPLLPPIPTPSRPRAAAPRICGHNCSRASTPASH